MYLSSLLSSKNERRLGCGSLFFFFRSFFLSFLSNCTLSRLPEPTCKRAPSYTGDCTRISRRNGLVHAKPVNRHFDQVFRIGDDPANVAEEGQILEPWGRCSMCGRRLGPGRREINQRRFEGTWWRECLLSPFSFSSFLFFFFFSLGRRKLGGRSVGDGKQTWRRCWPLLLRPLPRVFIPSEASAFRHRSAVREEAFERRKSSGRMRNLFW